jgi:DNA-binding MarR family transcriptional regulator
MKRLNTTWVNLVKAQRTNDALNTNSGTPLAHTRFEVLCLIAHQPYITRAGILKNEYFIGTSLSTIKRIVHKLLEEGLITVSVGESDLRERVFKVANFKGI